MSWSERRNGEQNERCEGELDHHVQTCGEEREWEDVLGFAFAFVHLEHPLVVDGNGDGEEVPARSQLWNVTAKLWMRTIGR